MVYFWSIRTTQVRDIAPCKQEIKSNLTLPRADSPGCTACLLPLFSLIALCTLIFAEIVFYLVLLPLGRKKSFSFLHYPHPSFLGEKTILSRRRKKPCACSGWEEGEDERLRKGWGGGERLRLGVGD